VDYTYRANRLLGRHGWLRLTPAYSAPLVHELLSGLTPQNHVLDPFSGTGTTGLVCAEQGVACDLLELNPFLVWLAKVKLGTYSPSEGENALKLSRWIAQEADRKGNQAPPWLPALYNIERWWAPDKLFYLGHLHHFIQQYAPSKSAVSDLLWLAFCQTLMALSNASFNHQSMSFKKELPLYQPVLFEPTSFFEHQVLKVISTLDADLHPKGRIFLGDARSLSETFKGKYDIIITSPPYPNRMSYIRELRPYMYWLGYLEAASQASQLDWQAIGGTWGSATSRLKYWQGENQISLPLLEAVLPAIQRQSPLLSNYIKRYFVDIERHFYELRKVLSANARVFYVIGNSKFYDTVLPVETLYAQLLEALGASQVNIRTLRQRSSKKELKEFLVSAHFTAPANPPAPGQDSHTDAAPPSPYPPNGR